ncbi:MAG: hypothetical protein KOO69_06190 [Victivallales bacterium]|nr:hypothetical protein [Victivallales bacterium]
MINTGKCPKCETKISNVKLENISVSAGFGRETWRGISYLCKSCNTVLSVQIDPISISSEILEAIAKKKNY